MVGVFCVAHTAGFAKTVACSGNLRVTANTDGRGGEELKLWDHEVLLSIRRRQFSAEFAKAVALGYNLLAYVHADSAGVPVLEVEHLKSTIGAHPTVHTEPLPFKVARIWIVQVEESTFVVIASAQMMQFALRCDGSDSTNCDALLGLQQIEDSESDSSSIDGEPAEMVVSFLMLGGDTYGFCFNQNTRALSLWRYFLARETSELLDSLAEIYLCKKRVWSGPEIAKTRFELSPSEAFLSNDCTGQPILWLTYRTLSHLCGYRVEKLQDGEFNLSAIYQFTADCALPVLATRVTEKIPDVLILKNSVLSLWIGGDNVIQIDQKYMYCPNRNGSERVSNLACGCESKCNLSFDDTSECQYQFSLEPHTQLVRECLQAIKCIVSPSEYDVVLTEFLKLCETRDEWEAFWELLLPSKINYEQEDDWQYLLNRSSDLERYSILGRPVADSNQISYFHRSNAISSNLVEIFSGLHLVFENARLDSLRRAEAENLLWLLRMLSSEQRWTEYSRYYVSLGMLCSGRDAIGDRNSPASFSDTVPSLKSSPPDIFEWLLSSLSQEKVKFPLLAGLSSLAGQNNPCANVVKITQLYECLHSDLRHILDCIMRVNFTSLDLECLPFGVSLPLREALSSAKSHPDLADSKQLYELIGTQCHKTVVKTKGAEDFGFYPLILEKQSKIPAVSDSFTGTELEDDEVSSLKFRHDDRVEVVQRIMSCNQAPTLSAKVTADLTEEAIKSEQQAVLLHLSNKIFALTIGRSIFTFSSAWPAGLSEMAKFPEITVSAKLPPLQELIVLDPGTLALDFFDWPHFHNGVAAGLRIPADSAHVTANWIIQNIPSTQNGTTSSAEFGQAGGFALAMGLSGHLKKLEQWQHLLFLQTQQHTITVGSLLGIAASCVETGDKFATKVLGVHIPRMMDPDALAALNEGEGAGGVGSIVVQFSNGGVAHTAAVFGIGLVHLGTGRRKFVELLLEEIGAGDYFGSGDNAEAANSGVSGFNERVKNREGHGVAAGIGLGMVLLGKGGSNMQNLEGVNLVEKLTEYIGSKRVHGKEYGGSDISAAGATIALGLIFLKSENQVVAGILRIPETSHMLDYVRSDLLMIRTLSRNLIMWKNIKPSEEWVESQIPSYIRDCYSLFETDDGSFESHRHAMHHIVAGACLSIAMKFAGSMDSNALRVVVSYLDRQKDAVNFPGKNCVYGAADHVKQLSLFEKNLIRVIMAGSGDPNVLRRLHQMSDEVSNNMNYGSHMALQMSLGFLFLGGGRGFTLGTSNNCIAALVCALYPRFPVSSNDNSCHLQALRHFWVFAVDRRRSLISRDVESGSVCVLPISIKLNSSVERIDMWTPCILPDLDTIESVDVFSERYFPVSLKTGLGSSKTDGFTTSQTLFVKRRAGHLDYIKDPKGQKSIFSRLFASKDESLTLSYSEKNPIMNESDEFLEFILTSFSQDPRVLAFAQQFCVQWGDATKEDCEFSKFCTTVLLECLENDSVESPEIYLQLYLLVKNATKLCDPVALYNLAIIDRFYSESSLISEHWISSKPRLVNPLFLESVLCRLDDFFSNQSVDGPFNDLSDLKLTLAPHAEKQGDVSWSDVYQATELDWDGVQNLVAGTEFRLAAAAKVYKKLFSERFARDIDEDADLAGSYWKNDEMAD
ncbi:Anaphase-promoting complex subunit 1 [Entophlyctis sp. JEL0112]|nr:Anaphase-promoting complex subunit 1 [Entophlyctis sp. JEL0112]